PRQGPAAPGSPRLPGHRPQQTTGAPTCPRAPAADLPRAQTPVVSPLRAAHASRTTACRRVLAFGLPRPPPVGIAVRTTTLPIAGRHDAASPLASPRAAPP